MEKNNTCIDCYVSLRNPIAKRCKDCKKKYKAEWMAEWRKNNPEKHKEIRKKSYQKTGVAANARRVERYHTDPLYRQLKLERDKERYKRIGGTKDYYLMNQEKNISYSKNYREVNRDKVKSSMKIYREKNTEFLKNLHKSTREELKRSYVTVIINKKNGTKIPTSEMPPLIIEAERLIQKIKRELKNRNHETRTNV